MDENFPLLALPVFETHGRTDTAVIAKACVSSLLRSLFSGNIRIFRNREMPIFKVERKQLEEIHLPLVLPEDESLA